MQHTVDARKNFNATEIRCTVLRSNSHSNFSVNGSVGWLVQVSLALLALTGCARLIEGVNANSVRQSAYGLIHSKT